MRNHFGIKLGGWDKKQGHDLVWKKESNDQDGGDLMDFKKHVGRWRLFDFQSFGKGS